MKNKQKGFVIPLIIAIIAILGIGSGVYVYTNKKVVNPPVANTPEVVSTTPTPIIKDEPKAVATTTTTTTVTKYTETNYKAPVVDISFKGDITTTVNCGNEDCFNKKFTSCEPATLSSDTNSMFGAVEYKIIGKGKIGCNMTFKYTKYPDPSWVNKEMTCEFDNKIGFQESLQKVFMGVSTGTVVCTGSLYDILRPR